jgi:hypothetical protein
VQGEDGTTQQLWNVDLAYVVLYALLHVTILLQLTRLVYWSPGQSGMTALILQHLAIALVALLRAIECALRVANSNYDGLTQLAMAAFIYSIEFGVFLYVAQLWAGLALFAMSKDALRSIWYASVVLTLAVSIVVITFPFVIMKKSGRELRDLLRDGAYIQTGFSAGFCMLVVLSGSALSRSMNGGLTASRATEEGRRLRNKILLGTFCFALAFTGCAATNAYSVKVATDAGIVQTEALYYFFDILALLTLFALLAKAVQKKGELHSKLMSERSQNSLSVSMTMTSGKNSAASSGQSKGSQGW